MRQESEEVAAYAPDPMTLCQSPNVTPEEAGLDDSQYYSESATVGTRGRHVATANVVCKGPHLL